MVCCVVECVTLLVVNAFALGCPWCVVETVGEDTSVMNALLWLGWDL